MVRRTIAGNVACVAALFVSSCMGVFFEIPRFWLPLLVTLRGISFQPMHAGLLDSSDSDDVCSPSSLHPVVGHSNLIQSSSDSEDAGSLPPVRIPIDSQALVVSLPIADYRGHCFEASALATLVAKGRKFHTYLKKFWAMCTAPLFLPKPQDSTDHDHLGLIDIVGPAVASRESLHDIRSAIRNRDSAPTSAIVSLQPLHGFEREIANRDQSLQQMWHSAERLSWVLSNVAGNDVVEHAGIQDFMNDSLEVKGNNMTTLASLADRYGEEPKAIAQTKRRIAALAYVLVNHDFCHMAKQLHEEMLAIGAVPILWTEKIKADETTLRLRVADSEQPTPRVGGQAQSSDVLAPVPSAARAYSTTFAQSGPTKVLQTLRHYSLLYRSSCGRFIRISFEVVCPLQFMANGKADVYFSCYTASELHALSMLRADFLRSQRLAITDGDGSVRLALSALAAESKVRTWHVACEIHRMSNTVEDVFLPLTDEISSIIRLQLTLQSANSMNTFRKALRDVIADSLDFSFGRPDNADRAYSNACMDAFLPGNSKTATLSRFVITTLFNGDWTDSSKVVHICPGCCAGPEECTDRLTTLGVSVIAGVGPNVWPRHRWKGSRQSINWLALLESIHCLLSRTYILWCTRLRGGDWVQKLLAAQGDSHPGMLEFPDGVPGPPELIDEGLEGDVGAGDAGGVAEPLCPDLEPAEDEGAAARVGQAVGEKHLEQDQHRRAACCWLLHNKHFPVMCVAAQIINVLEDCMDKYFEQAGMPFITRTHGKLWKARSEGEAFDKFANNLHRAFIATEGLIARPALNDIGILMRSPAKWAMVPRRQTTADVVSRAACMLSNAGCRLSSLDKEHQRFPWAFFKSLKNPEEQAEKLKSVKACTLDPWSADLLEKHRENGYTSAEFLADLRSTAEDIEAEMTNVEAGHSGVRRDAYGHSTHTWRHASVDANSSFVHRFLRRATFVKKERRRQTRAQKANATQQSSAPPCPSQKRKKRVASRWRAFVRISTLGHKRCFIDMTAISEEYKKMSAEDAMQVDGLVAAAECAESQPGRGRSAFGFSSRQANRSAHKRFREEQAESERNGIMRLDLTRDANGSEGRSCFSSVAPIAVIQSGADLWNGLGGIRAQLQRSRMRKLDKYRAEEMEMEHQRGNTASDAIQSFADSCPRLASRSGEFSTSPFSDDSYISLQWVPVNVVSRIKRIMSVKRRLGFLKTLFDKLDKAWAGLSTTVPYSVLDSVLAERQRTKNKRRTLRDACRQAGKCIHSGALRYVDHMRRSLMTAIMQTARKGSEQRKRLKHAEIVMLLVGQPLSIDGEVAVGRSYRLFHIGYARLTPINMEFQELQVDDIDLANEHIAAVFDSVEYHRAQGVFSLQYFELLELMETLDCKCRWSVALYQVLFDCRPVAEFRPSFLDFGLVSPLRTFWDPSQRRLQKLLAWGSLLESSSSESSSDITGECETDASSVEADLESYRLVLLCDLLCY